MQRTELGHKFLKLLGMQSWQVDALSLPFMKKVQFQHWQLSPSAILVAYIVFLGRPVLVRVIWWRQRKLIFLHGMDKWKGPLWLKPGICYTLLSVVNTWMSFPFHQQPISSYLASHAIILDLILWAYHAIMIGCWPAKPTPPTFCKVWLGHQWWLSDSSNCKPTIQSFWN